MCICKLMSFSGIVALEKDKIQCVALFYELEKAGIRSHPFSDTKENITKKTRNHSR